MGRTLPSASILLMQAKSDILPFQRALAKSDQLAIDELFIYAGKHVAEAAYAANQIPMETYMVAMILEMHREVIVLREKIEWISNPKSEQEENTGSKKGK
jgi:hypothetical protein